MLAPRDRVVVDPPEVGAGQVAIAQLQLHPEVLEVLRRAGLRESARAPLTSPSTTVAVGQRHLHERARPEEPEPVGQDQRDHAGDHAAGRCPRPLPASQMADSPRWSRSRLRHQIALYRSRSRCRMISATVLTTKVMTKSSAAARNSVR